MGFSTTGQNPIVVGPALLADTGVHLELAGAALAAGALIGIPIGMLAAYAGRGRGLFLGAIALGRTLPSLAVLAIVLPFLGVGFVPAVVALTLLAIPPIAIATDLGLRAVDAGALDAARGMGMTALQRFARIAWPLALPQIISGLRTAAIEVIASATLATFIGAGGLGKEIIGGLQTGDDRTLFAGAAMVALLALAAELFGSVLVKRIGATV